MSHSSGIQVSPSLQQDFSQAAYKAIFVQIVNEELVSVHKTQSTGDLKKDFEAISSYITSEKDPYYVIFQLQQPSTYLLVTYIPDGAQVRLKMLYSSTKNAMTKQLGDSLFVDSLYADHLSDLTYAAYQKHLVSKSDAVKPLTNRELELNKIKLAETGAEISISTKQSFNNGISLPFTNENLLLSFNKHSKVCLIFRINDKEQFEIESIPSYEQLSSTLPSDSPRFSLFNVFDGSQVKSFFLYTCPGSSPVRQRMFYSASRASLLDSISKVISPEVKSEVSEVSEVTKKWIHDECGFVSSEGDSGDSAKKSGFIKKGVSGPGKGPRRLVSATNN